MGRGFRAGGNPVPVRPPPPPAVEETDPYGATGDRVEYAAPPPTTSGNLITGPQFVGPTGTLRTPGVLGQGSPAVASNFQAYDYRIGLPPGVAPAQAGGLGSLQAASGNLYTQSRADVGEVAGLNRENLTPLAQAAAGQVPSAAELQGRAALEASQRATMSAAVTGRGGGGAQRAAVLAQSQQGLLAGQEAARLRADEQARARELYLQAIGQQGAIAGQYMDASGQYQDSLTAIEEMRQQGLISDQEAYLAAEQINADIYNNATNANAQVATANLDVAATRDENRRRSQNKFIGGAAAAFGGPLGFAFNAGYGRK